MKLVKFHRALLLVPASFEKIRVVTDGQSAVEDIQWLQSLSAL